MEPEELDEIYERLRVEAREAGLGWLLDEIDEASALGVTEVKPLRQRTRRGQTTYEELTPAERAGPGRRRAEEFLSRRPMTRVERVDALLDGLTRVLVDLDDIAKAAVEQLNELPDRSPSDEEPAVAESAPRETQQTRRPRISEIDFEPDEGSLAPRVTSEAMRHNLDRRNTLAEMLKELRDLVHG
jgi:hypothetical protein